LRGRGVGARGDDAHPGETEKPWTPGAPGAGLVDGDGGVAATGLGADPDGVELSPVVRQEVQCAARESAEGGLGVFTEHANVGVSCHLLRVDTRIPLMSRT